MFTLDHIALQLTNKEKKKGKREKKQAKDNLSVTADILALQPLSM